MDSRIAHQILKIETARQIRDATQDLDDSTILNDCV